MKSIAVIGLGQFGHQVAISLSQKGFDVVAIDEDEESITEIKDLVAHAIILDSTDEKAMRSVNIDNVDTAIVCIGSNVQSSLLTAALIQLLGIEDIHVRAINPLQESILKSMGIKQIIGIENAMGVQLANTIATDKVGRYIPISDRHALMEISVPVRLIGKALKDLHVRSKYKVNIVGIKSRMPIVDDEGEVRFKIRMTDVPDPNYPLGKDDLLVISGTDDNLYKFIKLGGSDD
jgi:trk system potassium uptake protein